MTNIPITEFAPDAPAITSQLSDTVYNVVPLTVDSYGPMPSHQPFSSALNARCQGALAASDNSGNVRVYAGDATKLYRIASPGTVPADVSKVGGYTTSGVLPWSFTVLNQRVVATNYNDPVQGYLEGTDVIFSNLITSGTTTLKAKYAAVIKNWLFLANTTDATFGNQPQRTWWSAINDPTNFPTPGTQLAANNLSDFQDCPGPHGAIRGIAGNLGTADGASFFERAVFRIIYTGLPDIFDFIPAEGARGLLVSGGLNQFGSQVAYPTEDGFYMFDGSNSVPIGKGKIDKFFYNDLQSGFMDRMCSAVDSARGLMFWAYPGIGSAGQLNRLLIYSPFFNRWTATDINSVSIEFLLRGATFGKTLEQLDAFGTIDTLPYSLDSEAWLGNRSVLAGFDTNHKYGYFDGVSLPARVDTPTFQPIDSFVSKIMRVTPLIDSTAATIAGAPRDSITNPVLFGQSYGQEVNGSCAVLLRGLYHKLRMQTLLGDSWTKFSGLDLGAVQPVGRAGKR